MARNPSGQRPQPQNRSRAPKARGGDPGDRIPANALTIWREKDVTQFKLGVIEIDETRSNAALEKQARERAKPVEAALGYAYLLDKTTSTAWWQEWAGYDMEEELLRSAVLARPAIAEKLKRFDPKDNDWGVTDRDDFIDLLIHAHHAEVDEDDIRKGFRHWLGRLSPDARRLFAADLGKWMRPSTPRRR